MDSSLGALGFLAQWQGAKHVASEAGRLLDAKAKGVNYHFEGDGWQRIKWAARAANMLLQCKPYDTCELRCDELEHWQWRLEGEAHHCGYIHCCDGYDVWQYIVNESKAGVIALLWLDDDEMSEDVPSSGLWCVMCRGKLWACSPELQP